MIINQITLKNFKSYVDETTLFLKPQDNKNIILIGGENGAGKSTLFEAIKLCIYGPMVFGYIGQNYHYISYLKSVINSNAFTHEKIESYVSVDIAFNNSIDDSNYTLKRLWTYSDQKINESFTVQHKGKYLENQELDYFEQYLKSVLPPFLLEFFFFDGEKLNNFFGSNNSNTNIYDSVIQLLNFDSFDILKNQLNSYNLAQSKNKIDLEISQEKYNESLNNYKITKNEISELILKKDQLKTELSNLEFEKKQLYINFKKSGGLLAEERNDLLNQINNLENKRSDINVYIRNFCNDQLPFIILYNSLIKLSNQVKKERLISSYNSINEKLNPTIIMEALSDTLNINNLTIETASSVSKKIINLIYNENIINNTTEILGLSKEHSSNVISLCSNILSNKNVITSNIIKQYDELISIRDSLKPLRLKINTSNSDDHLNNYLNNLNIITDKLSNNVALLQSTYENLEKQEQYLVTRQSELNKAKNTNISLLQSCNISNMTYKLQDLINELLKNLTNLKIDLIQSEFMNIFNKIIRKENFIDSIFIDDDFKTTLYIKKAYNKDELINIVNNIGYDNLATNYGEKFIADLNDYFEFESFEELRLRLVSHNLNNFELFTKIKLNSLSSGEKHIYIFCLIWAILKVSDVEIPFIIDTPYSRIDTTHRNGLTNYYLPNISKQVIVLSTNEEIDGELYKTIKPYISNEYLLIYDTNKKKTTIKNNYFEV